MRMVIRIISMILATVPAIVAASNEPDGVDAWEYVLPKPGGEHERGPWRALRLSDSRPSDLGEDVEYRGTEQRFTQLRYGSPNSTRIAVVVDYLSSGDTDVYLDVNRDRTIDATERLPDPGRKWRASVPVEWIDDPAANPVHVERTVVLQLSRSGRTLSFATAGYYCGSVQLTSGHTPARRIDGDGNGRFADPEDRIWIDLNQDGVWDRFSEQFLCNPILLVRDARYAVRTDSHGNDFSLSELTGTGTVQVRIAPAVPASQIQELHGLLIGRDGTAVALRGVNSELVVPVNEYRLASLSLVLTDPDGGAPWMYAFSEGGGRTDRTWYDLPRDGSVTIQPFREVRLSVTGIPLESSTGDLLRITPRMSTCDGLLLSTASRGESRVHSEAVGAEVRLVSMDGTVLAAAVSGFS